MNTSTFDPRAPIPAHRVDHLVRVVPSLEAGCDEIEALLGVRPVPGGRHPDWGTHNALLSIGPATYLELIAADPQADPPARGVLFGADRVTRSRLVTWAHRAEDLHDAAAAVGRGIGPISAGHRTATDGTELTWQLSDPCALPLGGAIPFLIAWRTTPHPARTTPRGGDFIGLRVEHPDPGSVRGALRALGSGVEVVEGDAFRLAARIRTVSGEVLLD